MSGTGHNASCNMNTLLERAAGVLASSAALRRTSSNLRTALARSPVRPAVRPTFGSSKNVSGEPALYLVAVVFSAGGLQPLIQLLHGLPPDFSAAVAVANHMGDTSCLPDLLCNQTRLRTKFAEHGEQLFAGTVYVCPPKHHLVINPDARVALSSHSRIRHARPSADWFLRTVAGTFGERAAGVVLSGASGDGAEGIARIGEAGGLILVQEPSTCLFPTMPGAAIASSPTCVLKHADEMAAELIAAVDAEDMVQARADWEQPFGPLQAA
jgi:two-component system chemotaxis response regulator CheB